MRIARSPIAFMLVLSAFIVFSNYYSSFSYAAIDDTRKEQWIGMYLNGKKMGWTSISTAPAIFRGQNYSKITTHSVTKMVMFGQTVSQDTETITYADSSNHPKFQEHRIRSKGSLMELQAEYKPDKILISFHAGGTASSREVAIPAGAKLIGDSTYTGEGGSHEIGKSESYYYLNPLTIALEKTDIVTETSDKVKVRGIELSLFRVKSTSSMGAMRTWETPKGELVKAEMTLGPASIAMYQESKESAQNLDSNPPKFEIAGAPAPGTYVPPDDFALATAVAVNRTIVNPRNITKLRAIISGVTDPTQVISDDLQKATPILDRPGYYAYEVISAKPKTDKTIMLPITDSAVKSQLTSIPYLEGTDSDLISQTKRIVGNEKGAAIVVQKIRSWVFQNMTPDYTIGVPRSSGEIFHKRRGVCRDYATLFAGMARVAGIPTRLAGGIVYGEGKFFYHAWAECWIGEWIPVDPTLNLDVVDATHLKFAQGDVTDMYRVATVVGRLKIEILETQ